MNKAPPPSPSPALFGTILLVDDDDLVRRSIARNLHLVGHDVVQATSGAEALRLLGEGRFDIVVSDIHMPDMDGVELLRRIRETMSELPVVLMTAVPNIATAMSAVELGACEYLPKPLDVPKLGATIQRAIKTYRTKIADRDLLDSMVREKSRTPRVISESGVLEVGTIVADKYRIVRQIGAGGMGTVYEARREDLGAMPVALKILHSRLATRDDSVRRFRREAEVVAALRHPNIVTVFDFVATPEENVLVMELLQGTVLTAAISQDPPFPPRRAAFIVSQILAALDAAHARGIVHRDLKPDNVFLTRIPNIDDVVKVLDFGIAKLLLEDPKDTRLTDTGTVLGTPAYMAPEYARGEKPHALGDIYAAGCVMYELLAKRPPFAASNYNALLFAILDKDPPALTEIRSGLSPELVAVVAKAMDKDPSRRFTTAREMESALSPWLPAELRRETGQPSIVPVAMAPTEQASLAESGDRPRRKE